MTAVDFFLSALVAVVCGLDRTAACQFMLARPIVAAPLAGLVLGDPLIGLQIGFLLELLWIGRLPVGAAIPPDDTQVAVAGTLLAIFLGREIDVALPTATLLALLIAMPLGKMGQLFERAARHRNDRLIRQAQAALAAGRTDQMEKIHRRGLLGFGGASLATFACIVLPGMGLAAASGPSLGPVFGKVATWLWLAFPLAGTAVVLGTINVKRSVTLFGTSFTGALLMLWLS